MPRTRTFDGKRYKYTSTKRSARTRDNAVDLLRAMGYLVRVVKTGTYHEPGYDIYTRKK
jgi:hypothetical protein